MDQKRALHDELTEAFIKYQFRIDHPMPQPHETDEAMYAHYRHDAMFNRRVKSLTSGVMSIVGKYILIECTSEDK